LCPALSEWACSAAVPTPASLVLHTVPAACPALPRRLIFLPSPLTPVFHPQAKRAVRLVLVLTPALEPPPETLPCLQVERVVLVLLPGLELPA